MKAVLLHSRRLSQEVKHFLFEVPGEEELLFVHGQFVSLTAEIAGRLITRAYSICSPPSGNRFEICLNRVHEGIFSPYLFDLKPGSEVHLRPPLGHFTLRSPARDSVFVATGTGIAPFRSILHHNLPRETGLNFTLLFGVRYEGSLLYREEFEVLRARHARFRFWPTLSRPGAGWHGRIGHVQAHLEEALGGARDMDVYICGLKLMVDDVRARLKTMGFQRDQIRYEKYD